MENLSLDGLHRLMNAISAREEYLRKVKEELERRLALGQPESATVETTAAVTMEAAETVTANNEGETERSEEETNEQEVTILRNGTRLDFIYFAKLLRYPYVIYVYIYI